MKLGLWNWDYPYFYFFAVDQSKAAMCAKRKPIIYEI